MPTAIEQAYSDLADFESTEVANYSWAIENTADEIRKLFGKAGQPVVKGSDLDARINGAFARAHTISAQDAFETLEAIKGSYSASGIRELKERIYEHFAAANLPVIEGSPLHNLIERRANRAYILCAERELEWLESLEGPLCESRTTNSYIPIEKTKDHIRERFAAAGVPITQNSYFDTRIEYARSRAHMISGMKLLVNLENVEEIHSNKYFDFMAEQIRKHFRAGGMGVSENSYLDEYIKKATANAKLLSTALDVLPPVRNDPSKSPPDSTLLLG